MGSGKGISSFTVRGLLYAIACGALLLQSCGGGGGSSSGSGSVNASSSGGFVGIPGPVSNLIPITAFADAGGGNVTVVSANTLAPGDIIIIAGTANYDNTYPVVSATATDFVIAAAFAGTETGTWQLGGGLIAGCATTGNVPNINPSIVTSRFSGVAPLAVFFDASGTITNPATPRPFHDLGYGWNFGDAGPSAGSWATGSRPGTNSRNTATGPVAAHVYESPGTYTVTLTVTDGTNTVSNACIRIAVQDPAIVFAGANTICFSPAGNFTDAPCNAPGTLTSTTSNFATAIAMAAPGRRLLFHTGETWTAPTPGIIAVNGPGVIGAYGPGTIPVIQSAGTILQISGAGSPNISDWRIMDLRLDGQGSATSNGVLGGGGAAQFTFLRVRTQNTSNGFQFSSSILDFHNNNGSPGHLVYDQIAIVNSVVQTVVGGSGGNGVFMVGRRLMLQGNTVTDTTAAEHVMRLQYVGTGVVQANDLSFPALTKHVFTLRGVVVGTVGVTAPNVTEKVVISDNLFQGGNSDLPISIRPSAASTDERIRNIIFDGNIVRAGPQSQFAVTSSADEITLRNNVVDVTGATSRGCFDFNLRGAEPAHSEIRLYNNTCVANDVFAGTLRVALLDATNSNVSIVNNLGYAPGHTAGILVTNLGSVNVTGASGTFGNSSNADITNTSPNFAAASPTNAADFALNAPSYAIGSGVQVPVFTDLFRGLRPQGGAIDSGASEQ